MDLSIRWSQSGNRIDLEAKDHELKVVARHIAEVCADRGPGPFEFIIQRTPTMQKLFNEHLANMRFTLLQFKLSEEEEAGYDILVYRSRGVMFSAIVEEVADGSGT